MYSKCCSKCKQDKDLDQFYKNKSSNDGLNNYCKQCKGESDKDYRNKYKIEKKEKDHKYYEENKEKIIKQVIEYQKTEEGIKCKEKYNQSEKGKKTYKRSKDKFIQEGKWAKYLRDKRKNDDDFKIQELLRGRVYKVLKNTCKSAHTLELLGCSLEHFKQHIESKFQEGMTWENQGKWHLDHIIPCKYFDLTIKENQFICFNYRNLQPLWAKDNRTKWHKIPENVLELIEEIKYNLE